MEITRHEITFYKLSQKLATNKTSFINKKTCKYNRHKYIMALAAHNSVERGKAVQLKPIIFIRDNEIQTKVKLNFLSSNLISNYLYLLFYVFIYAVYKEYTMYTFMIQFSIYIFVGCQPKSLWRQKLLSTKPSRDTNLTMTNSPFHYLPISSEFSLCLPVVKPQWPTFTAEIH